jgi:hypothetical protein
LDDVEGTYKDEETRKWGCIISVVDLTEYITGVEAVAIMSRSLC